MEGLELANFENQEIEEFIRESFELNFELLRLDSGIALSPEVKQTALNQVILYWRVLKEIALKVTDTEVRLSLPRQESPKEREFGIEGIVDIVRDDDQTIMYDIKTHDTDFVRSHIDLYEDQLNVYSYIWQELHKQSLDKSAVICTDYPREVQEALERGDDQMMIWAVERWHPVIEIDYNRRRIEETIREFGKVVDQIEENEFKPASVETLNNPFADGQKIKFGTRICRNCDARFACDSYRVFARHGRGKAETNFRKYYAEMEKGEPLEEWRSAGLGESTELSDLLEDY